MLPHMTNAVWHHRAQRRPYVRLRTMGGGTRRPISCWPPGMPDGSFVLWGGLLVPGLIEARWWVYVAAGLALTHVTIVAVTVFLHRCQAHRALELHPVASHFFRFWLWLTTGMVTREWVAIHRKHHARCETEDDPHSPQVLGIHRVLWGGVFLYVKEARNRETLERYGQGTPDDWMERNIYGKRGIGGVSLMLAIDVALFGIVPGLLIWLVQMVWIPFWAAGVVNGVGHYWGYRNWPIDDEGRNVVPWGILIGGEELHNNHHAYPTSAKLSNQWFEFDLGWLYIRLMALAGLAKVKRLPPRPRLVVPPRPNVDEETLRAVLTYRYELLRQCAKALRKIYCEELRRLRRRSPADARVLRAIGALLRAEAHRLEESGRMKLVQAIRASRPLHTVYLMRAELAELCGRYAGSYEDRIKRLQNWCERAEASGIRPLMEFSTRLRSLR
jgi:stearoyl-CoA desaturase (Delta-9 desaturase)